MKIAIACSSYPPYVKGGGEISTQLLVEALSNKGLELIVLAASDTDNIEIVNGVKVYRIKSPNIYWSYHSHRKNAAQKLVWHLVESYNPFINSKLLPILEEEKPTVLHTSTIEDWSPAIWKVAHDNGINVIHTLRSYSLLCPRATMFKNGKTCNGQCIGCKAFSVSKKMHSHFVDSVVGISKYILEKHLEYGFFQNAEKRIIYNQVEKTKVSKKNFHYNKKLTFGYIGRLHQTKGVKQLLEYYSNSNLINSSHLLVAGEGPLVSEVERFADKFSSISYIGYTDPVKFFNSIDVLIVPSLWDEPFGRVIIESFYNQVPVIASKVGGITELVNEGINGYLFNPEEFNDLLKKMRIFISTPDTLKTFQDRLKEFDTNIFSSKTIADEYLKVYKA